ncbi:MAG TPA: hypothetical protein VJ932_10110, partial [Alkalispirochaeta sp.]|nr:hypothetical protein [Alkalispirochaeta sp.]
MNVPRQVGRLTWIRLGTQSFLSRLVLPLFYPIYILLLRYALSYRIPELRELRRKLREDLGRDKRP